MSPPVRSARSAKSARPAQAAKTATAAAATAAATDVAATAAPAAIDIDPLAFQVLNEIGIIDQLAQNRAARLLGPALNLSQFVVLNHFSRLGGPRSLVQLASAMQVTKGAMSNTVARLAAKGLVVVQPDPADGRSKQVRLSDAGHAARQQALADLARGLADLDRDIPPETLLTALPLLRQLRVWFDSHR